MKFKNAKSLPKLLATDVVVVPYSLKKNLSGMKFSIPKSALSDFKGSLGDILIVYADGARIALLGLGEVKELTGEKVRDAYGSLIQKIKGLDVKRAYLFDVGNYSSEILEGSALAAYHFENYKLDTKTPSLNELVVIGESLSKKDLSTLESQVKGVFLARDLVNQNADKVRPAHLVSVAKEIAKKHSSIKTTVFDKKRLEKEKFGLLLAVGQGSVVDPALITATYKGSPKSKEHIVIVGKGVTYDTGGLNLKGPGMITMKCDMGGAATCLGLLSAVADAKLKTNITIVIPTTENSISGNSYKPGDVYTSYSGKSIEIGNTDAEGRLILADALSYTAQKLKPTEIIDLATLTGAIVVALGEEVSGLFTNCDKLASELLKSGEKTGEELCRLPLVAEMLKDLKSDIADLKNVGGRDGGSIKAALFLQEFVDDASWAHLDIAGTAYRSKSRGHLPKNATGVGVRLLFNYLSKK